MQFLLFMAGVRCWVSAKIIDFGSLLACDEESDGRAMREVASASDHGSIGGMETCDLAIESRVDEAFASGLREGSDREVARLREIVSADGIADNPHAKSAAIGLALDMRDASVDRIVNATRRLVSAIVDKSAEKAPVPQSARLADRLGTEQTDSVFAEVNAHLAEARDRAGSTVAKAVAS